MRLLIITQDFPPRIGGIENYTRQVSLRLAASHDTTVVAPLVRGSAAVDAMLPFRVVRVPVPPNALPLALRPVLNHLLKRGQFDATLHSQWQTARFALQARERGHIGRVFIAAHGRELLIRPDPALARVTRAYENRRRHSLAEADLVFAVSRYTAEIACRQGARQERVVVVPNGVDPTHLASSTGSMLRDRLGAKQGPVLLTVCRLVPRKGVDLVLRSLPELLRSFPDLVYVVVGDGPERRRLQTLAAGLGVARSVRWEGRIAHAEIRHYFAACDLFVLAPRNLEPDVEGFGLVYLEAAAAGKPVVASDAGGIADAVVNGETGLLVPEGSGAHLSGAIINLLSNPEWGARLAAGGKTRVLNRMTWDVIAAQMRSAIMASLTNPPLH